MKLLSKIAVLSLATCAWPFDIFAQSNVRVVTEGFLSPSGFNVSGAGENLRVMKLDASDDANDSTHLLIEGLTPVEAGSQVVASNYTAINLDTGEEKEVGRLYFEAPAGAFPVDVASSPIVGIVARSGPWETFNPSTPASDLGGASGQVNVDLGQQTLSFTLNKDSMTYKGTANYSRLNDTTLEVSDFTLTSGSKSIEFHGAQLVFSGVEYYGVVQAKGDPSGQYDSLMFAIRLQRLPDFDGDGYPDLTDGSRGDYKPVLNAWKYDDAAGWIYGLSENWGRSQVFGNVFTDAYPWLYVQDHGWISFGLRTDTGIIWFWDHNTNNWAYTGDFEGWYRLAPYGEDDWHRFYEK